MPLRKWAYYLSKFTLIDELLGFVYWAFAIYGIFLITGNIKSQIAMISILLAYVVTVAIFYIFILKKIKKFFMGKPK